MRTISLRLDHAADALLRRLCEQSGSSQTDVMVRALGLLAQQVQPTAFTLAEQLALIGSFRGATSGAAESHSIELKTRLREQRAANEREADAHPESSTRTSRE